jgi:hypothetical protein
MPLASGKDDGQKAGRQWCIVVVFAPLQEQ